MPEGKDKMIKCSRFNLKFNAAVAVCYMAETSKLNGTTKTVTKISIWQKKKKM